MIIGFDARYAEGDLVGVGKYIQSLVTGVAKSGRTCIVFYSREPKVKISGTTAVILNSVNRYHFEQVLLPIALKKYKVDLYHATGNVGVPLFCPVPALLTVHDIIPLEIKDYFSYSPFSFLSKLSYVLRLKASIFKAAKIVTDSNYVKNVLIIKLKVTPEKIQTIYLGSPGTIMPGKLPLNLIGKKYVLNHGGIDIRKNLDRLIEAFALVHKKHGEIKLVITGENKRMREDLEKLIGKLNLGNSVVFTGYLDDATLSAVIKSACLICYPTLSEGFGFPVLEGFGKEIPVISSNISSIPEVVGNAAILVNPERVNDIAGAMEKVLDNSEQAHEMVLKGKAQYNKFSWEKCVNEYLDLYNHI
ncbi:MAG: Glycosyl transferase group 1 [Candidatus Woesebacteria bacterium GW2011_GWA2_40_7b]|uniref:Glycosyl transferase group 1 n=1 Tax=Candidatus Woesebacteria bacterium GW2011_GWA2_40_7b TaxID=1618563 RepID=A0A0G0T1J5_9BACT|nr:MAG: Glycosyl transferase group 1 [Candidatus Woesebacteria bacterium GW2011_GWA2_40_7b]